MQVDHHDLHHEFPDMGETIRALKLGNHHFARLFNEYHALTGVVPGVVLLNDVSAEELALGPAQGLITPASPFEFPMHCHTEMSQAMLGGNYPMGLVTHWEILGDRQEDGTLVPFPGVPMPM